MVVTYFCLRKIMVLLCSLGCYPPYIYRLNLSLNALKLEEIDV